VPAVRGAVLVAALLLLAGCAGGRVAYEIPIRTADHVALWDADGDGRADYVLAHGGPSVDYLPQGRHGMASTPAVPASLPGVRVAGLAVGRFGPVPGEELAILDSARPSAQRILVYRRLGDGAAPVAQIPLGAARAVAVAAGDLNGDGYDDIAVSSHASRRGFGCVTDGCVLLVLGGAAGPSLSPLTVSAGPVAGRRYDPARALIADVDRDGRRDLVVPDPATRQIVLVPGARGGLVDQSRARVLVTAPYPPVEVTAAMLEGSSGQLLTAVFRGGSIGTWKRRSPAAPFDSPSHWSGADTMLASSTISEGLVALGRTDAADRHGECAVLGSASARFVDRFCGPTYTHQGLGPQSVAAPPAQLDFGNVQVGQSATLKLPFESAVNDAWKSHTLPLEVRGEGFAGDGSAEYDRDSSTVTFTPTTAGAFAGTVTIGLSGEPQEGAQPTGFVGGPLVVPLRGIGVTADARGKQIGFTEDATKYADDGGAKAYADFAALGAKVDRWSLVWDPAAPARELSFLDRAVPAAQAAGVDLIVAAYPAKASLTGDPAAFCGWLKTVAQRYPSLRRFVIGNEVNATRFWAPQHTDGDALAGPRSYYAALTRCYDALKSVDGSIQVIGMGLAPRAVDGSSTKPLAFIRALGSIYRADGSRRSLPIMDAISVHPYPNPNASPPPAPDAARYADADFYGIPQLDRVKQAVWDAFHGTAQKTTLQGLPIVVDEVGYQTATAGKPGYTGVESSPVVSEADQARYYARVVDLLACDPAVSDLLFFHLVDESQRAPDAASGGWQSGLEYPDGHRKPSFGSVASAIAAGCARPSPPLPLTGSLSPFALHRAGDGTLTWDAHASAPSPLAVTWTVRRDGAGSSFRIHGTSSLAAASPVVLSISSVLPPGHYTGRATLAGSGGTTYFALDFAVPVAFSGKPALAAATGRRAGDGALAWSFDATLPEPARATADVRPIGGRPVRLPESTALRAGEPVSLGIHSPLPPGTYVATFHVRSTTRKTVGIDLRTPPFTVASTARPGRVAWKRVAQSALYWTTGLVTPKGGATVAVRWGPKQSDTVSRRLAAGDPVAFGLDTAALRRGAYRFRVTLDRRPLGTPLALRVR
jgi:FG-GAP repeat protein